MSTGEDDESRMLEADGWVRLDLPAGTVLWEQGDLADRMVLLTAGLLRVEVDGRTIEKLGPGNIIGELAALGSEHVRTATVVTVEPTVAWELDAAVLGGHREARSLAWHRVVDQVMPQLARRVDRTRRRAAPGSTLEPVDPADVPVPARWASAREALGSVAGLSTMSAPALDALGELLVLEAVAPGTDLVVQDGFATGLVVLASGKAEVWVGGELVGELNAGTLLGADTLVRSRSWRSTVRTATPAQVLRLGRDDWWELREGLRLEISEALFEVLRAELVAANRAPPAEVTPSG